MAKLFSRVWAVQHPPKSFGAKEPMLARRWLVEVAGRAEAEGVVAEVTPEWSIVGLTLGRPSSTHKAPSRSLPVDKLVALYDRRFWNCMSLDELSLEDRSLHRDYERIFVCVRASGRRDTGVYTFDAPHTSPVSPVVQQQEEQQSAEAKRLPTLTLAITVAHSNAPKPDIFWDMTSVEVGHKAQVRPAGKQRSVVTRTMFEYPWTSIGALMADDVRESRRRLTDKEVAWLWRPRLDVQEVKLLSYFCFRRHLVTETPATTVQALWDGGPIDAVIGGKSAQLKTLSMRSYDSRPAVTLPLVKQAPVDRPQWDVLWVVYRVDKVPVAALIMNAARASQLRDAVPYDWWVSMHLPGVKLSDLGFRGRVGDVDGKVTLRPDLGDRWVFLDFTWGAARLADLHNAATV